jgi:hypothetical protein
MDRLPNERATKPMTDLHVYLQRVHALVASISLELTDAELAEVNHLIDHNECGEALRTLAWIVVDEKKHIPIAAAKDIRDLSRGLVAEEDLPSNLEQHAS